MQHFPISMWCNGTTSRWQGVHWCHHWNKWSFFFWKSIEKTIYYFIVNEYNDIMNTVSFPILSDMCRHSKQVDRWWTFLWQNRVGKNTLFYNGAIDNKAKDRQRWNNDVGVVWIMWLFFFLYGRGGTSKTFLWKTLSACLRSERLIV